MSNNPNNPNEYNGYPNYETWAVSLWIDNDQDTSEYWRGKAAGLLEHERTTPPADPADAALFTPEWRATFALADRLQGRHEALSDQLLERGRMSASVFSDLLNAALGSVDWRYIARNMIEDAAEND